MSDDTKQLYQKLDRAHQQLRKSTSQEEKLAIANYIGNLYSSLICMGEDVSFDKKTSFGSLKNYKKFVKKLNNYSDRLIYNYLVNQEFHKDYISEIIPDVEEELQEVFDLPYTMEESILRKREFNEILFEFMKSIHQDQLLQDLYKKDKIHPCLIGQEEDNLGFALYNPMDGDCDIFIRDFDYNFRTMQTLVHELGHAIDFRLFHGTVKDYNEYFYCSFYGEVISRLMERLLLRFLIHNKIYIDESKEKYIEFEDLNHDYLLQAYIMSLLDQQTIVKGEYMECSEDEIINQIQKHFIDGVDLTDVVERMNESDLSQIYNYTYGDILSLFLCDEIENNGYSSDLFEYFLSHRTKPFHEKFLRECGFGPVDYVKKYKKELNVLKN